MSRKHTGIVKRGGRWKATYDLGPDPFTGTRRQRARTFATFEDAKAWRSERVAEVSRGVRVDAGGLTVGDYLETWLEGSTRHRADSTKKALRSVVRTHIVPAIGGVRLRDLSPAHCASFYAALPEEGTARFRCHSALSRAMREAVRLELISRNPVEGLAQPYRAPQDGVKYWTPDEMRGFLDHIRDAPPVGWSKRRPRQFTGMWHICSFALATGLRLGELLALKWEDVSLEDMRVRIVGGKTRHARRTIEVDPQTVSVLREWRRMQFAECGRQEVVWTYSDGGRISHGAFQGWFERVQGGVDVTRLTPHGMRHTHAAIMLGEWDIFYVSRRLGHSSVQVTDQVYGHLIPAVQRSRNGRSWSEIAGIGGG